MRLRVIDVSLLALLLVLASPASVLAGQVKVKLCLLSSCASIRTYNDPKEGEKQWRAINYHSKKISAQVKQGTGLELRRMQNNLNRWHKLLGSQIKIERRRN